MLTFACCAHMSSLQAPVLSTHVSINLRVDRGLVSVSLPQSSLSSKALKPALMQLSACDILDSVDCQEQWNLLMRSHLRLPGASPAGSSDVIIDVLSTALERIQDAMFAAYGHALNDTCVTLVSPATCDWGCRDRWRRALERTAGRMRLCGLCRETSALWHLMLSGKETQTVMLIEDEFSGTNVLDRESADDTYWAFVGDPSMLGPHAETKEMLLDALVLRPPNQHAYAIGGFIRRGEIVDQCLSLH